MFTDCCCLAEGTECPTPADIEVQRQHQLDEFVALRQAIDAAGSSEAFSLESAVVWVPVIGMAVRGRRTRSN